MARKTRGKGLLSQRQMTWIWILATIAVVVGLLYWEQIALLYVLATLAVTALLLIVAFADLHDAKKQSAAITAPDSSLATDAAITAKPAIPRTTFGSKPRKRR